MNAFGVSFENLRWLPLLLAALIPIILILLDRRRARRVEWPAMRFLVRGDSARIRRLRRREALLLLLRTSVFLAVGCAVLRPVATFQSQVRRSASPHRSVALVLDDSWSLAYRETVEGGSSFERAKEAALEVLDGLAPGSQVAFLPVPGGRGGSASSLLELDAARRSVRDATLHGGSFELLDAFDRASELLAHLPDAPSKELYVLTDLMAAGKAEGDSVLPDEGRLRFLRDRLASRGAAPALWIIDAGAAEPRNQFVASFALGSLAVGIGETTSLRATVEAVPEGFGPDDASLRLSVDGLFAAASQAKLDAHGRADVALTFRPREAGDRRVTVELPADGLHEDDEAGAVLEVIEKLSTLVVGASRDLNAAGTSHYVELALEPRAGAKSAPPTLFRWTSAERLTDADLAANRLVVITGLPRLDAEAAQRLESFVRAGGGLLIFASRQTDSASFTDLLYRAGRGLLPAAVLPRSAATTPSHPAILAAHPSLAAFASPDDGDLARITVKQWTPIGPLAPDAAVIARLDGNAPWILEKRSGLGKVILVTTSAAPDDSDLPRTPLFLPLVHGLARYLGARDSASRAVVAGEPMRWRLPPGLPPAAGLRAVVLDPRGKEREASLREEDRALVAVDEATDLPGFHTIRIVADGKTVASTVYSVAFPAEESRLVRLRPEAAARLASGLGARILRDVREATGELVASTTRREIWPALLGLAAALLFAEQMLVRSFAPRRRDAPEPTSSAPRKGEHVQRGRL